ncbi:hypothetical protein EZS27_030141 [termite gut metagenome]|uniref:Uncharacterized protein n=1 Tax=termite gut metagenome TaxID=433724 RepID=A0A5J4QEP3_9ZZZZ
MKRIFYIITAFALISLFPACEPIVEEANVGTIVKDASELKVTIGALYGEDGYLYKVQARCESAVLCQWTDGINTSTKNDGEFAFTFSGDQYLTLNAFTADGRILTKNVEVKGVIAPPAYPAYGFLFGYTNSIETAEKSWVWNDNWDAPDGGPVGAIIMSGGAPSSGRDYWGWTPLLSDKKDVCNEGEGSKMVLTLKGKKITKYDPQGKVVGQGSINFDMTPTSVYGSLGTLTFAGTNILFPYDYNNMAPWSSSTFTITYLDDDHLMLFIPSSNGGWYYVFNAE